MPLTVCMPVLAAGGLDWLETLLPLLFVLFWIVSQVWGVFRNIGGNRNAEGPRRGPIPDAAGRPPAREPRQPPPAEAGRREPRREEVAARPPQNEREAIARQIEEFLRDTTGKEPRRPPVPPRPAAASPPKPPARDRRRRQAQEAVRRPALRETPSSFQEMPHLAEPLTAREAVPAAVTVPASPAVPTPTAADLVALFRDPATLRQLILVREVLDRPVGRW